MMLEEAREMEAGCYGTLASAFAGLVVWGKSQDGQREERVAARGHYSGE